MSDVTPKSPVGVRVAAATICGAFAVLTGRAILALPQDDYGLAPLIEANAPASGVKNVVTAVLLNFRGYDTMLEIVVLMLATIGVLSLAVTQRGTWDPIAMKADPMLAALVRFLAPIMVLVAGYLLWAGEHAPGGAFQAGAILGAAGVLLALAGFARPAWVTRFALRASITVGFLVFLGIAFGVTFVGGNLLEYPAGQAKILMLVVETWLTISIASILISLFVASASPIEDPDDAVGDQR